MPAILIIDDSAYMRTKIRGMLEPDGYKVLEASDGVEGLQSVLSNRPDCVILDLIMPEIDGLRVLRTLREKAVHIPIIVMTADIQENAQRQCAELGAAVFMNKPPREDELRKAVRDVLAARRTRG